TNTETATAWMPRTAPAMHCSRRRRVSMDRETPKPAAIARRPSPIARNRRVDSAPDRSPSTMLQTPSAPLIPLRAAASKWVSPWATQVGVSAGLRTARATCTTPVPASTSRMAAAPAARMALERGDGEPLVAGGCSREGLAPAAVSIMPRRSPLPSELRRHRDSGEVLVEDRRVLAVGDDGLQGRVDGGGDVRVTLAHGDAVVLVRVDRLGDGQPRPALDLRIGGGLVVDHAPYPPGLAGGGT